MIQKGKPLVSVTVILDERAGSVSGGHDNPSLTYPAHCPLLSMHDADGCRAALMGRLYYRAERLAELADRAGDQRQASETNDAALALGVYRRHGRAGLSRLEGDFALIVWDGREKRLVGMRDPLGGYPLFWTQAGGKFAMSTSLSPLRDLRGSSELDMEYVSEYLMLPAWSLPELEGGRTIWHTIQRVMAGTIVEKNLGSEAQVHRYWCWPERIIDPGTDRLDDIVGRYGELLRQSVRERMRGRTAAHLSGGMDSTTVCLLAAQFAQAGQAPGPVIGLSLVYERLTALAREKPYLDLVTTRESLLSRRVLADELLDYDSFHTAAPHDEPCPWLWRTTMEKALIEHAAADGATTIMSGVGADEIVDQVPYYLTTMLRRGSLWAAWSEAARWGRADNCSRWQYLYPFGIANLLPAWLRAGIGAAWRGGFAPWEKLNEWTIAPWIRPEFAKRHHLRQRGLENVRRIFHSCPDVGESQSLYNINNHVQDFSRWYLAAPLGIVLTHPFLDTRLLSFGLGLHARLRPDPNRRKEILADAMRDILPEPIRTRKHKAPFNEVFYLGLARNLPALEQLVRDAPIDGLDLLDKNTLLTCLQKAALGASSGLKGMIRLNVTLTFLKWFTQQCHNGHNSA
jgi:asparagine synthase (glutamine-hydrolysing)